VDDAPLFPQPRRRVGQAEALLSKTLRAWHADGYLAGDAWASARGVLRDAARAVDAARADLHAGDATAYSFARTVNIYAALMASYRDGGEVDTSDGIDSLIANISGPPVRHAPDA
jgi:hypothetical protein